MSTRAITKEMSAEMERLRETVRKRELDHLDACAEADELRAEVGRLTKLLDVCVVTHTHNVTLKEERDKLRLEIEALQRDVSDAHHRGVQHGEHAGDVAGVRRST